MQPGSVVDLVQTCALVVMCAVMVAAFVLLRRDVTRASAALRTILQTQQEAIAQVIEAVDGLERRLSALEDNRR